jgi:hypothetical protein
VTQDQPPVIRTGINYVRVDVIVTDNRRQRRYSICRRRTLLSTEDGKLQKIEIRSAWSCRSTPLARRAEDPADHGHPQRLVDEEREAARRGCPAVRDPARRLPRAPRQRHGGAASRSSDFIENQLAPADMVALMYPLTPVSDIRFSRNRGRASSGPSRSFEGRKFNYRTAQHLRAAVCLLPCGHCRTDS